MRQLLHKKDARLAPRIFLVDEFVLLGAKAWQSDAIAIASLGYDVENVKVWFLIVFHRRNFFRGYSTFGAVVSTEQPS